ncbi:MAG TPA: ABC transporter substrate-binding protein [Micromonosporaceae bacterium]|nr:ABC transporter substrate-binding protein [Micromonosporaceae bacterium]
MQRGSTPNLPGRRRPYPSRIAAAVTGVALLVPALAACRDAGADAAPPPVRGGALTVYLTNRSVQNLDPQEIVYATDANISRLINRTLTATTPTGELVPDLATDTGRPSKNNTVWDFTLKPGLAWADGSPVTCDDVRYGIERRWDPTVAAAGGLPYPLQYLKDNPKPYKGPARKENLNSIVCTDARTVEFHLVRSVGDFGYTVSVPTFAPIQPDADHADTTGQPQNSFTWNPDSNGPYKVDPTKTTFKTIQGQQVVMSMLLVRNNYWDQATDPIRKAYPDTIAIQYNANNAEVTNDLINSVGQDANAVDLDQNVAPNFVQQVINDPELSQRAITGLTGSISYFSINMSRVTNLDCRKALEYGFDRRTWRYVQGGAVAGDLATSMIPPSLPAHLDFDLYATKSFPDGDVKTAQSLMTSAKCRSTITVAFPDIPLYHQEVNSVADAYARIGIQVKQVAVPTADYYTSIGDVKAPYDLMYGGWVPDWPNGSAVIPPLFSSGQLSGPAAENLNQAHVRDQDAAIQQAFAEADLTKQYKMWGQLDQAIMKEAAVIPIIYPNALRMIGTNVRGVVISTGNGQPDLATIGLGS